MFHVLVEVSFRDAATWLKKCDVPRGWIDVQFKEDASPYSLEEIAPWVRQFRSMGIQVTLHVV